MTTGFPRSLRWSAPAGKRKSSVMNGAERRAIGRVARAVGLKVEIRSGAVEDTDADRTAAGVERLVARQRLRADVDAASARVGLRAVSRDRRRARARDLEVDVHAAAGCS